MTAGIRLCFAVAVLASSAAVLACAQDGGSTAAPVATKASRQKSADAENLCRRLSEIKVLPFKGEEINDPVYNGLKSLGDASVPCLVKQMTNTTVTKDPRKAPKYKPVRVGDVAFWVLLDITKLPYDDVFPETVRKRFKTEGVYAYFAYVSKYRNRLALQRNVERYLRQSRNQGS